MAEETVTSCMLLQDTLSFTFKGGTYSLAEILPHRFGPMDLIDDPNTPLLLQPQGHTLRLTSGEQHAMLLSAWLLSLVGSTCLQPFRYTKLTTCKQGQHAGARVAVASYMPHLSSVSADHCAQCVVLQVWRRCCAGALAWDSLAKIAHHGNSNSDAAKLCTL